MGDPERAGVVPPAATAVARLRGRAASCSARRTAAVRRRHRDGQRGARAHQQPLRPRAHARRQQRRRGGGDRRAWPACGLGTDRARASGCPPTSAGSRRSSRAPARAAHRRVDDEPARRARRPTHPGRSAGSHRSPTSRCSCASSEDLTGMTPASPRPARRPATVALRPARRGPDGERPRRSTPETVGDRGGRAGAQAAAAPRSPTPPPGRRARADDRGLALLRPGGQRWRAVAAAAALGRLPQPHARLRRALRPASCARCSPTRLAHGDDEPDRARSTRRAGRRRQPHRVARGDRAGRHVARGAAARRPGDRPAVARRRRARVALEPRARAREGGAAADLVERGDVAVATLRCPPCRSPALHGLPSRMSGTPSSGQTASFLAAGTTASSAEPPPADAQPRSRPRRARWRPRRPPSGAAGGAAAAGPRDRGGSEPRRRRSGSAPCPPSYADRNRAHVDLAPGAQAVAGSPAGGPASSPLANAAVVVWLWLAGRARGHPRHREPAHRRRAHHRAARRLPRAPRAAAARAPAGARAPRGLRPARRVAPRQRQAHRAAVLPRRADHRGYTLGDRISLPARSSA